VERKKRRRNRMTVFLKERETSLLPQTFVSTPSNITAYTSPGTSFILSLWQDRRRYRFIDHQALIFQVVTDFAEGFLSKAASLHIIHSHMGDMPRPSQANESGSLVRRIHRLGSSMLRQSDSSQPETPSQSILTGRIPGEYISTCCMTAWKTSCVSSGPLMK
jgi:hypothetical protein